MPRTDPMYSTLKHNSQAQCSDSQRVKSVYVFTNGLDVEYKGIEDFVPYVTLRRPSQHSQSYHWHSLGEHSCKSHALSYLESGLHTRIT